MSVAKPCTVASPAPVMSHTSGEVPVLAFSHTTGLSEQAADAAVPPMSTTATPAVISVATPAAASQARPKRPSTLVLMCSAASPTCNRKWWINERGKAVEIVSRANQE
jgi:hypothetical protein